MHSPRTDASDDASWRVDDLLIDPGLQRVVRDGSNIELPRLSFDLLLALVGAAPRFLSNEELMSQVWKGVVVSPETVTQRVKLLRDALGDDPRQPRYIEGLRGRGYRIIPVVEGVRAADARLPDPAVSAAKAGGAPQARSPRPLRWIAAAMIASVIAGAALIPWNRQPAPQAVKTIADRTVAILPFSVSGAEGSNGLAAGLADAVLAQLSEVQGLQLVSGNSSFQVDASKLGTTEAGRRLGARYLIQGSVQQAAENLRVTATLIDSNSGVALWSRRFDREARDFFALQDAVAAGIVKALQSRIAGLDPSVPTGERSRNPEAQLAYFRGRTALGRTTVAGALAAEQEFLRACELDESFVPAIVGLYDARLQAASLLKADMAAARAANAPLLERATRLQPQSGALLIAEARWGTGTDAQRAELFERGLQRDPADARAMTEYSELLDANNRRDEAAQWLQRALRADPLWPRAHFRSAQRNFPNVGSAIEQQTMKVLELDPNYFPALQRYAKYRWQMHGEIAFALAVIERAIAADPLNPWGPHTAIPFYLDVGDPAAADELIQGNPVVAASTAALRAQYAGDAKAAGQAALSPGSFVFGRAERWGVARALRDYALRGGPRERILRLLSERYALPLDGHWRLEASNFREALLLAHLQLASGQRDRGMRGLEQVIAWIDANAYMGPVFNLRTKAEALALRGEDDAALALLGESFASMDYTSWWYTLQYDPAWKRLHAHPRFVAIAASVRAHVAGQAQRLRTLRAEGQVPQRGVQRAMP